MTTSPALPDPASTATGDSSVVSLRTLIAGAVESRWTAWSQDHPNLAQAVDRTQLIDMAVTRLRDDPAFMDAMAQAHIDEKQLAALEQIGQFVGHVVDRLLPL